MFFPVEGHPRGQLGAAVARGVEPVTSYRKVAGQFPLVEVSLGKLLKPQNAPDVLVSLLHGSHRHHCMNAGINYCESDWTKVSTGVNLM